MTAFSELTTKKARIAHIKQMLATNDRWAIRALLRIYENQTEDEKSAEHTRYHNKIGFSAFDSEILTSFAKQVLAGRTMSPKQMALIHKKIPKYAKQLEGVSK